MREREPQRETIERGELFYLHHPGTNEVFSGYGLTMQDGRKDHLVGLLMVDRPAPAIPEWLQRVADTYGECRLAPMTASGERGLLCQMVISPEDAQHLERMPGMHSELIQRALQPLLAEPPTPTLFLVWDDERRVWRSEFARPNEMPEEIKELFERFGYGCLALETTIGVVHVCHAADADIAGFLDAPVSYQWQLIKMPTAPLVRLVVQIFDHPQDPYQFESFLNVAEPDQAGILAQLAGQDRLLLSFFGDDLGHRFTVRVPHGSQSWQQVDDYLEEGLRYWETLPQEIRDFDLAKIAFTRQFA